MPGAIDLIGPFRFNPEVFTHVLDNVGIHVVIGTGELHHDEGLAGTGIGRWDRADEASGVSGFLCLRVRIPVLLIDAHVAERLIPGHTVARRRIAGEIDVKT